MNQLKAAIGCLALITVTLAPLAMAHTEENIAIPNAGSTGTSGADRVAGVYYADIAALLGTSNMATSGLDGLTGAAFGLCDMEVLSDGSAKGADQDEARIDGNVGGAGALGANFNDGGIGAACHTPVNYYAESDFNSGNGCSLAYYGSASVDDAGVDSIFTTATCAYGYSTGGVGVLDYAVACISGAVLTLPGSGTAVVGCVTTTVACLTGSPPGACPLATTGTVTCGSDADGVEDVSVAGASGFNTADFPAQTTFSDFASGTCPDTSAPGGNTATGTVFVWTGVFVDASSPLTSVVSAPTVGIIS